MVQGCGSNRHWHVAYATAHGLAESRVPVSDELIVIQGTRGGS